MMAANIPSSWPRAIMAGLILFGITCLCRAASDVDPLGGEWGEFHVDSAAPDYMTTTDGDRVLKVTRGVAAPSFPGDVDMVHFSPELSANGTAVFTGRTVGWGCKFDVWGVWVGTGGGGAGDAAEWHNKFVDIPRIILEVNGEGVDDNFIPFGPNGGTLTIRLEGGSSSTSYEIHLSTNPAGSPAGEIGFGQNPVPVYGNGQAQVTLEGIAPGFVQIAANTTQRPHAEPGFVNAVVFRVRIYRNDADVTDTTSTIMVGEKVLLEGRVEPGAAAAAAALSPMNWTVPGASEGIAIANYTQDLDKGEVTPLTDLHGFEVKFYWITGGTNLIAKYNVTLGADPTEAVAKFNVLRPSPVTLTSTTTADDPPVDVGDPGFGNGIELVFGSILSPGITWDAEVETPDGYGAGDIGFVQLALRNDERTKDDAASTVQTINTNGVFVLDDLNANVFYTSTGIADGATSTLTEDDTPGMPLRADDKKMVRFNSFQLYVMYKPDGADNIWVTLRILEWHWEGSATKDLLNGDPALDFWSLDPGSSSSTNPSSFESTDLPQWTDYWTNLVWANQ